MFCLITVVHWSAQSASDIFWFAFLFSRKFMGSKPVREAHLIKYGARLGQLNDDERRIDRTTLLASCDRLSKPRRCAKKFIYESKNRSDGSSAQMDDLFPTHADVDEVASVAHETEYPEDWRRLPTEHTHGKLKWLYECLKLDIETPLCKLQQTVYALIDKQIREHGVSPVDETLSRRDVRDMVRDGERFGVLVDIVATRKNILSGVPHDLAAYIYRFLEEEHPITVKFVFVGITDNATKLVAKDVFDARSGGGAKKISFADIDGEHLHIAYPKQNEADVMRQRGVAESKRREEERRIRTWTPKYVPPPEPEWMTGARFAASKAKQFLDTDSKFKCTYCSGCDRCWSHNSTNKGEVDRFRRPPKHPTDSSTTSLQMEVAVSITQRVAESREADDGAYSFANCTERLREVRRRHRQEKSRNAVVTEASVLKKVVERISERLPCNVE